MWFFFFFLHKASHHNQIKYKSKFKSKLHYHVMFFRKALGMSNMSNFVLMRKINFVSFKLMCIFETMYFTHFTVPTCTEKMGKLFKVKEF